MTWDWSFAAQIVPVLLQGLIVTVEATLLASALALLLGLPLALARRARQRFVRVPVASAVEFVRRTPLLVQLYFIFYVLPQFGLTLPAFAAGVIGLGVHYSTYTSEVYRSGIESVPRGQWEAARALNYSRYQLWSRIVIPQAIPPVVPALGNYILSMYKESALLSAITVIELMNSARIIANSSYRYFEPMTLVGLLFLLVSLPSAQLLRRLEAHMVRRD